MSMKRTFKWNPQKGLDALHECLKEVGANCANYMVQQAKEYAPEDTGALKDSIGVVDDWDGWRYQVVCSVPYAAYQEWGWYDINSTWHGPVAFMRRALQDTKARFKQLNSHVRLGGAGRHVSEAEAPIEGAVRHHTFQSESHKRAEQFTGSYTGP